MRIILLIILFLNFSFQEKFDIKVVHNPNKRESLIYLSKNNIKTDSIIINDYYGKNAINKIGDNLWSIEYSTRCGTGCITRNIILINIVNKKINIPLHTLKQYKDSILNKTLYIEKKVNSDLYIKLEIKKYSKINKSSVKKLTYDDKKNIYYNCEFNYDGKAYRGIKFDSLEYIFYDKKWAEFSTEINKIYYDF